jgi:catechol 2,3-dioxygenase
LTSQRLPADARIGSVRLRVRDLEASAEFYETLLGLVPAVTGPASVTWSNRPGERGFIGLEADSGIHPRPDSVFGIYHYAILYPDRASLAVTLRRFIAARWPFTGFSDHGVSEAAYLDDPDGIGVELYVDRPSDRWPRDGGAIAMYTRPLDLDGLLAEADRANARGAGRARVGHVHLHVRDLAESAAFYTNVLGLDSMAELPGARFLSAGGYHHHLGLNTWARREAPPDVAGLAEWVIEVGAADYAATIARVRQAGVATRETDGGCRFVDPDGNAIIVRSSG